MNISAILICATVTVFAFAIGEAIAPALIEGTKNILLFPFRMIAGAYRSRYAILRFILAWVAWISAWVVTMFIFHWQF